MGGRRTLKGEGGSARENDPSRVCLTIYQASTLEKVGPCSEIVGHGAIGRFNSDWGGQTNNTQPECGWAGMLEMGCASLLWNGCFGPKRRMISFRQGLRARRRGNLFTTKQSLQGTGVGLSNWTILNGSQFIGCLPTLDRRGAMLSMSRADGSANVARDRQNTSTGIQQNQGLTAMQFESIATM